MPNLSYLFSIGTIGAHRGARDNHLSTRFSPKMVSTGSRAGVNKQADAGPSGPAGGRAPKVHKELYGSGNG